ncbi:MAG: dihydrofolate reductase [Bacilli bacterium]
MIKLIVATDEQNGIGIENTLPWRLPTDLQFFKKKTVGQTIIMGRETYDSIGKPLPNRRNIVCSRSMNEIEGVEVVSDFVSFLQQWDASEPLFVIGGATIYAQALPYATEVYVTKVLTTLQCDTFFPTLHENEWKRIECTEKIQNENDQFPMQFVLLRRREDNNA